MFIRATCGKCKSRDVMHFKHNGSRLDQYCRCGINLTAPQIRKQVRTRRKNALKTLKMPVKRSKSYGLALILMLWAFGTLFSLPFMSWKVEYARADTANELPKTEKLEETILEKINRIALAHNLKPEHLAQIISCESRFDPKVQSHNYIKGVREKSFGLAQIHITVHPVTKEQAQNPEFAINFLADHWKQRHQMWVTCSRGI